MKKSKHLLALVLAFSLIAAACSGSDDSNATDGQDPAGATIKEGEYKPSGSLTINQVAAPATMNPFDDPSVGTFHYYSFIYEGLIRTATDGTVEPWLAEDFETSQDGKTVTFTLHENITFHDGEPFNAEAVVKNIEFVKNPPAPAAGETPQVSDSFKNQFKIIDSVEAIDENTVAITMTAPGEQRLFAALLRQGGFIVSPKALGDADANPAGTGPYTFDNANSQKTEFTFKANDTYWKPELVGLEEVAITQTPAEPTRVQAFNAGQYEATLVSSKNEEAVAEKGTISHAPAVPVAFIINDWLGEKEPALANKDVRCAIAHSINKEQLAANDKAPGSTRSQFAFSEDDYGYIEDLAAPEYDEAKAKELLEEAGVTDLTLPHGHIGISIFPGLSQGYASELSKVGITLENEDLGKNVGRMLETFREGTYPVQIITLNEPNALTTLINRTGKGPLNATKQSPEGVEELVIQAQTASTKEAEQYIEDAMQIMIEECIWNFYGFANQRWAVSDSVSGLEHTEGIPNHFWPHGVRVAS